MDGRNYYMVVFFVILNTRVNLWYKSGEESVLIKWVLVFNTDNTRYEVVFSTDINHSAKFIIESFIKGWSIEVTFEETRSHLGVETQRQWSDSAILRTTPILMALFSLISILANEFFNHYLGCLTINSASWYKKDHVTFSDVRLLVKKIINSLYFNKSTKKYDMLKFKTNDFTELINTLLIAS